MKSLIKMMLIVSCIAFTIISCRKNEKANEVVVKSGNKILLGNFTPYRVDVKNNDTATIGFLQSARLFTLDLKTQGSKDFLNILKSGLENDVPLEVKIFANTSEIAEVNSTSNATIKAYKSSKVSSASVPTKNSLPVIPSRSEMLRIFQQCANSNKIAFGYAADGCYARAHKMRQIIIANGYDCAKIFCYGNLSAQSASTGCCANWGYHVAPVVSYKDAMGNITLSVFDPSLFASGDVSINAWLDMCQNKSCNSTALVWSNVITDGNVYVRGSNGSQIYDDTYASTDCTNNYYLRFSGCTPVIPPNCSN